MRRVLIPLLLLIGAGAVRAAEKPAFVDENAAKGLVAQYKRAKSWALKGMVLLSLGPKWHPAAAGIVSDSLEDRDKRLRAYGIEALLRTDGDALRRVATPEIVAALIAAQRSTNEFFGDRVRKVLAVVAPAAGAKTKKDWILWWNKVSGSYAPLPWKEVGKVKRATGRTVAYPFLKRGFDLQENGLEMVIVIDSTGSMQPAINQARDAVVALVDVLGAIAPTFKLGLVTYRDDNDPVFKSSTRVLSKLTRNGRSVRAKLASLRADGGGDAPERVSHGLEKALRRSMGWSARAAKVVVLVGDAPAKNRSKAVSLARAAHNKPETILAATGKTKVQPFIVSAIGASTFSRPFFEEIVKAGGGSYAEISRFNRGQARRASLIVHHILILTFGQRWKEQVGDFLRIYDRYKRRKYIK